MAAVSQTITNMLGGISQQPDPIKLPGQVREAVNAYLDPTFGCRKRPGTRLVSALSNTLPDNVKWFPILRDDNEHYVCAAYFDGSTFVLRVWDMFTGIERTVTTDPSAQEYFEDAPLDYIKHITVGDYTLITNPDREVTMGGGSPDAPETALVSINQLGYNTTYSIGLSSSGAGAPVKVYRATGLEVLPGSYEVRDDGLCTAQSSQSHVVNDGGKTGLTFQITNQCSAYLKSTDSVTATQVDFVGDFRSNLTYDYIYSDGTNSMNIRVYQETVLVLGEPVVQPAVKITANGGGIYKGTSFVTPQGDKIEVTAVKRVPNDGYVSKYQVSILLQNGGVGWRVGDVVQVTQAGKTFDVRVTKEAFEYVNASDGLASYTTPVDTAAGTLSVGSVTASLVASINAIAGYTAEAVGNVIRITSDGRSFNVEVLGGSLNQAMQVVKRTAQDVASLPSQGWDGTVVQVQNTERAADDYYVKFETETPGIAGSGYWKETVQPGIPTELNSATMPFALIREADGDFSLGPITADSALGGWGVRGVGDEVTCPDPSFVGNKIVNFTFYSNRLGLLSKDTIVFSQPGDYFNFFNKSAIAVSDADPIDLLLASVAPASLNAAVITDAGVLVFTENGQFLLKTEDSKFSSQTVSVREVGQYSAYKEVDPVSSGISVFFISDSEYFTKVLEMSIGSLESTPQVADDTRVIPQYIPRGARWMLTSLGNDLAIIGDDTSSVYVFKYFNQGNERKVAGWTRWQFPGSVVMMSPFQDGFYLVTRIDGSYVLSKLELLDDPNAEAVNLTFSSFSPRLDNAVYGLTPTVLTPDTSRVFLPEGSYSDTFRHVVVAVDGEDEGSFFDVDVEFDINGDAYFDAPADRVADAFVFGIAYEMLVTLPSIYTTLQNRPDIVFSPIVENVYLNLYYSGHYVVRVRREGYPEYSHDLTVATANNYLANDPAAVESVTKPVPVFCKGNQVELSIIAGDPLPSALSSYTWHGHYNNRAISPLQ